MYDEQKWDWRTSNETGGGVGKPHWFAFAGYGVEMLGIRRNTGEERKENRIRVADDYYSRLDEQRVDENTDAEIRLGMVGWLSRLKEGLE